MLQYTVKLNIWNQLCMSQIQGAFDVSYFFGQIPHHEGPFFGQMPPPKGFLGSQMPHPPPPPPSPRAAAAKSRLISGKLNEFFKDLTLPFLIFFHIAGLQKRMANIAFAQCQNLNCFQGSMVQLPLQLAYALAAYYKSGAKESCKDVKGVICQHLNVYIFLLGVI